jgi:hypothetical protein
MVGIVGLLAVLLAVFVGIIGIVGIVGSSVKYHLQQTTTNHNNNT